MAAGIETRATGGLLFRFGAGMDAITLGQALSADGGQFEINTTYWSVQALPGYGGAALGAAAGLAGWSNVAKFAGPVGMIAGSVGAFTYAYNRDGFGPEFQQTAEGQEIGCGGAFAGGAVAWGLGASFTLGFGVGELVTGAGMLAYQAIQSDAPPNLLFEHPNVGLMAPAVGVSMNGLNSRVFFDGTPIADSLWGQRSDVSENPLPPFPAPWYGVLSVSGKTIATLPATT